MFQYEPLLSFQNLAFILNKKNILNSKRRNSQERVRYYKRLHKLQKSNKKKSKMSLMELRHTILKNEADVLKYRIQILNFNKKCTKKIHQLMDEVACSADFAINVIYDAGNFATLRLSKHSLNRDHFFELSLDEMRRLAEKYEATRALENMLTKG